MSDHDELLARAETELAAESGPSGMHYGDSTKRELYEALRTALAARPQPLFALTKLVAALDAFLEGENKTDKLMPERMRTAYREAKAAMAGSATPTQEADDG